MYTRSITNKLNLLKILYDNACEDIEVYGEYDGSFMQSCVKEAKMQKDIFRRRILATHLGSLLST